MRFLVAFAHRVVSTVTPPPPEALAEPVAVGVVQDARRVGLLLAADEGLVEIGSGEWDCADIAADWLRELRCEVTPLPIHFGPSLR